MNARTIGNNFPVNRKLIHFTIMPILGLVFYVFDLAIIYQIGNARKLQGERSGQMLVPTYELLFENHHIRTVRDNFS